MLKKLLAIYFWSKRVAPEKSETFHRERVAVAFKIIKTKESKQ